MSRKRSLYYYVGGALVLALAAVFVYALSAMPAPATNVNSNLLTQQITIGSAALTVEVASTEAEREQGLSGRSSLLPGRGMLFIFQQPGQYGFWMKDMQFSLDMIFADANGNIITVAADASPSSYNNQNPQASQVFYPSAPIEYVLEVPAGFAAANNIKVGDKMQIGQ